MSFTRYVLIVVIDPTLRIVVGIEKRRGPTQTVGKWNFPGGKIEHGESVAVAASRELREETGLEMSPSQWITLHTLRGPDYELNVVAALSAQVHLARTLEDEPVRGLSLDIHRNAAACAPERYAPDFLHILDEAMIALGLTVNTSAA